MSSCSLIIGTAGGPTSVKSQLDMWKYNVRVKIILLYATVWRYEKSTLGFIDANYVGFLILILYLMYKCTKRIIN